MHTIMTAEFGKFCRNRIQVYERQSIFFGDFGGNLVSALYSLLSFRIRYTCCENDDYGSILEFIKKKLHRFLVVVRILLIIVKMPTVKPVVEQNCIAVSLLFRKYTDRIKQKWVI